MNRTLPVRRKVGARHGGGLHRHQRKLLSPPLTGARLRAFGDTMQALADKHVAKPKPGSTIRALQLSTEFTLDVIIRTALGVEGDHEDSKPRFCWPPFRSEQISPSRRASPSRASGAT